ncbi:MAG: hypothetical protein DIU69_04610 [Bacillota bacterium]|nr:MAG: hypothetical protein DIU69_04610 [Bacillota bacterium]
MPRRKVPREHRLPERLSEILRQLPEDVSMASISRTIGVKSDAVARWARGVSEPNLTHLLRLANYLQVSLDDLLGRKWKPPTPTLPPGWAMVELFRFGDGSPEPVASAPLPVASGNVDGNFRGVMLPESWTPTVPWAAPGDLLVVRHGGTPLRHDAVVLVDGTVGYVRDPAERAASHSLAKVGQLDTLQGPRSYRLDEVFGVIVAHLRRNLPPHAALRQPEALSEKELVQYLAAHFELPLEPLQAILADLVKLREQVAERVPDTPPPFPWWAASAAAHTPPGTTPPLWELLGPAGVQAVIGAMQALYQQWWAQADPEQRKRVWEQWQNLTRGANSEDNGNKRSEPDAGEEEPPA